MTTATIRCLNQVNSGSWCQESYETASRYASRRAAQLRKLGYAVTVGSIGSQVTRYGTVKVTLVNIRPGTHQDTFGLPDVENLHA